LGGGTKDFFNGEGYNIRWEVEKSQQESGQATSKFDRRKGPDDENEEIEEEGEFHGKDHFGSGKPNEGGKERPSFLEQNRRGDGGSDYRKRGGQQNLNKNWASITREDSQREVKEHGNTQMEVELNQDTQESRVAGLGCEEGVKQTDNEEHIENLQKNDTGVLEEGSREISEEEQLDYEDDPISTEKAEMEELENKVEMRANKLLETAAINISTEDSGMEGEKSKGLEGKESKSSSATTDDDDEIDWDHIQESLDNNLEVDVHLVKKNKETIELRRSARHKGDMGSMLEKAEAAKKKSNELAGNLSYFAILNTVDNSHLEKLAKDSNIKLGDTSEKIASTISSLQANEIAKASILSARRKMAEQASQKKNECENAERNRVETGTDVDVDVDMDRGTETDGDCPRPSRKPPRRKQATKAKKGVEEGQGKKCK
jgi:hypothetical protein